MKNNITAIAIDDEPFALEMIESHCKKIPYLNLLKTFSDPYDANMYLKHNTPDLVLLDIQMPEISGLHIAEKYRDRAKIIFTTAHGNFAIQGFDLNATDYLLKPFNFERFKTAIEKVKETIELTQLKHIVTTNIKTINVKVEYKNMSLPLSNILYIEAMDNYAKIYFTGKMFLTQQNLKSLYKSLPKEDFIRIHKSFIVNKHAISSYIKSNVKIGKISLPVGRVFANDFIGFMNKSTAE